MKINAKELLTYLSIGGILVTTVFWLLNTVATKQDLLIAVSEVRLTQIEESLLRYQRMGINNLSDFDKHRYENLLEAEKANDKQRRKLLGLE